MKRRAFETLMHWVQQRELARRNKETGNPFPYCDDEIINKYRFCNVIRQDDRVSRWLKDNWYDPNWNNENQWFACAIARYFNWPATLEVIGYPKDGWNPEKVLQRLRAIEGKTFSAAYIIPAPGGTKKIEHVVNNVLTPLFNDGDLIYQGPHGMVSMELSHAGLIRQAGFGSFLAGQVIADWRQAYVFKKAPRDRMTWAPLGPGSIRGINRLMGREATQSIHPESREVMLEAFNKLRRRLDDPVVERMEMMDFQSICCETDKYMRTLNGEGTPKVQYVPNRGC